MKDLAPNNTYRKSMNRYNCPKGECCHFSEHSTFSKPKKPSNWKAVIFGIIVILTVGAFISSCTKKEESSPAKKQIDRSSDFMYGLLSLSSIKTLDTVATDKDVVFIILPGEDQENKERMEKMSQQLILYVDKFNKENMKVDAFILEKGAGGYDQMLRQFVKAEFPVVVVMGKNRLSTALSGNISEERLRRAYETATKPVTDFGSKKGKK